MQKAAERAGSKIRTYAFCCSIVDDLILLGPSADAAEKDSADPLDLRDRHCSLRLL